MASEECKRLDPNHDLNLRQNNSFILGPPTQNGLEVTKNFTRLAVLFDTTDWRPNMGCFVQMINYAEKGHLIV